MSNAESSSVPVPIAPRRADMRRSCPTRTGQTFFRIMEVKMKLTPKEIEAILPPLHSQEDVPDPVAVLKFFDPCGRYTFYVLEGREPDGDLALFGFCRSPLGPDCDELGHTSRRQLESVRGPLGLR